MIKCSECGNGVMKKATIIDDRLSWHGHGQFQKRTHNGHHLKVGDKEFHICNQTHMEDEVIVVCSNFPECGNYYVMKKYNFDGHNLDRKVGQVKVKGYGKYHYNK